MKKNDELIRIAASIEQCIQESRRERSEIKHLATKKAHAIIKSEAKLAVTLAALKNGKAFKVGSEPVQRPAVGIMEKIAKGIIQDERLEQELAENMYKACIVNLSAIEKELSGFQSIFRYLDEKVT